MRATRQIQNRLALALLLVGAVLTMGAKWAETPITDFSDVAGTWTGLKKWSNWSYPVTITIKQDGSYEEDTRRGSSGTMRIVAGKIQYESAYGFTTTVTLYERKGKRVLRAKRGDGVTWKVKPAKQKQASGPRAACRRRPPGSTGA